MDFAPKTYSWVATRYDDIDALSWDIGSAVLSGVLLEVSAYPKPGLVAPRSMGAHKDMNLQTFMLSSAAIAPCLYACAKIGLEDDDASILPVIRGVGREFDRRLLQATHGVNTQRGILFSAGIICAAAGLCLRHKPAVTALEVLNAAGEITKGLCARELHDIDLGQATTAGEILFRDYGVTGIRGEVEAGFPTIANFGYPALRAALATGCSLNRALVHALINLIAEADDTTVLWRGGREAQDFVRGEAARICADGGALAKDGVKRIDELNAACIARNISPGGAADLLAVTAAVYLLEYQVFPEETMIGKTHDLL